MIGDDLIEKRLWERQVRRRRHAVKFLRGLFIFVAFFAFMQLVFQFSLDIVASFVIGHPLTFPLSEWQHVFAATFVTGLLWSLLIAVIFFPTLGLLPKGPRSEYLEQMSSEPFGNVFSEQEYQKLVTSKAETATQMKGTYQLGWSMDEAVDEAATGTYTRKDRTTIAACWDVLCYSSHTPDFERAMAHSEDWQDLLYEMAQQIYTEDVRVAAEELDSER